MRELYDGDTKDYAGCRPGAWSGRDEESDIFKWNMFNFD